MRKRCWVLQLFQLWPSSWVAWYCHFLCTLAIYAHNIDLVCHFYDLSLFWALFRASQSRAGLWLNRSGANTEAGLQLLLMCCFLCTAAVDEVKVQQWHRGVHTLSRKQLVNPWITPNILHGPSVKAALLSSRAALPRQTNKYRLQQCIIAQRTYKQLCWVTFLMLTKKKMAPQAFPLMAVTERMAVVEHRTLFVTGEEVESLKRGSCSFPTPMAYERSKHHRSSFYQPPPTPAPRRESISHTCRGYGGKIHAGEGSLPGFYSQCSQGRRFEFVFRFLERRCQDRDKSQEEASLDSWHMWLTWWPRML